MAAPINESSRVALVTGAGQGIGEAIALRLAKDGLDVAVNDVQGNLEKVSALSKKIVDMGRKSSVHIADVSEEDQVARMIDNVVKEHGSLDVMVANAGIVLVESLLETTVEQWDKIFAINVRGVFLCYKYAGKQMVAQGRGGRMVGASSLAGKRGSKGFRTCLEIHPIDKNTSDNTSVMYAAYCGTKFAVRGITQAAAGELGRHGITVNAYAPGCIDTALGQRMDERISELNGGARGQFFKSCAERSLLGYNGTTEDIAGLVSYLVSKEAHFVTGQTGIGEAIALRLAEDGLDVAVNDISGSLEKVTAVSEKIVAMGRKSSVHIADVSSEDQVEKLVKDVVSKHGSLDIMIANAGIVLVKPFSETTVEEWDRIFSINVRGVFLCYKHAGKQMITQGRGGRIVAASSLAGKVGTSYNYGAYIGTKFAVRGITQAAAGELGRYGITVNAYAPGVIESAMSNPIPVSFPEVITYAIRPAEHMDQRTQELSGTAPGQLFTEVVFAKRTLVGYNGVPNDVASLVSYLVSKEAHFVTGWLK
ncbi:NAD(P)-binding protein [Dendrothele bispora CBS 962.96]|uniref:NAD(P)-binding protein n=1 Tax=Dendrothele bispora (strain CBS 962.96) TaxID=1314807 RepID=A0A4S8L4A5_DENBC|nr:NAD(P)-binding protein [Dendrothele bispora CBS 962.96]